MKELDPEIERHMDDQKMNILYIGRIDRQKQPLVMARIARGLKRKDLPFIIHVLGAESLQSQKRELLSFIHQHALTENIICSVSIISK